MREQPSIHDWPAWLTMAVVIVALGLLVAAWPMTVSAATYYGVSPEQQWFKSLRNPESGVPCCDEADGEDVQWDIGPNGYRVFIAGEWRDVPPLSVLHEPNMHGRAIVWWYATSTGEVVIRCFLPGAGL